MVPCKKFHQSCMRHCCFSGVFFLGGGGEKGYCFPDPQVVIIISYKYQWYHKASFKLKFFLFADDTNLLYANKNLKTLENTVNTELIKLCDWLTANKLTLNIKKSNFVLFRTCQKRITTPVNIRLFDNDTGQNVDLDNKECVKYLGVLIDSHLFWKNQKLIISAQNSVRQLDYLLN